MKLPFSYKHHFFSTAFSLSLVGHSFVFALSGTSLSSPQFSVAQAPSSVEFEVAPAREPLKENSVEFRVVTIEDPNLLSEHEIRQPEEFEKTEKSKDPENPEIIPPVDATIEKGALVEATADLEANPAPEYPLLARQRGWEGQVLLRVIVGVDGQPLEIDIVQGSGYKVLDLAARRALAKWSFNPAHIGSFPFQSQITIPVRFVLDETV